MKDLNYDKKLIPDIPETPASEMNKLTLAMLKVSLEEFSEPEYKDQLQMIRQGLESANRAFNKIQNMQVTKDWEGGEQ